MAKDKILKPFVGIITPENKFTVDTIDDLKSRNYLTIGDIVDIRGYYIKGDRGAHKRIIESTSKVGGIQLANGLWANVLPEGQTVYAEWFGLTPNTNNASPYFNLASEYIYRYGKYKNQAYGFVHEPVWSMKCVPDNYMCLDTIKVSNRRDNDFCGSTLDFNNSTAEIGIDVVGIFDEGAGGWNSSFSAQSLSRVTVKGLTKYYDGYFNTDTDFHKLNYMYKAGFIGINLRGTCWTLDVVALACEKGINVADRDSFLLKIDKMLARFCKYGLVLDLGAVANSNENIRITNSVIGNCWASLYAKQTGAYFTNCSFDYSWYMTEPDNPWDSGNYGTQNGPVTFDQCWFEDTRSNVDYYFSLAGTQMTFSNSYFILPNKKFFLKAENANALVQFSNCLFGHSCPIATESSRIIMRGVTYHKQWSSAGAGKFRKRDNLVHNGYMDVPESTTDLYPDGNRIYGWDMNISILDQPGVTPSTLVYSTDEEGKHLLNTAGKFLGCRLHTGYIPCKSTDFIVVSAKSTATYCEIWFYNGLNQVIKKQFISTLDGKRYSKLNQAPQGATSFRIIFANEYLGSSGGDTMKVYWCEANIIC